MQTPYEIGDPACGLRRCIRAIGGKWKPLILCKLDANGTMRYNELRRAIAGITNVMLAKSLQELEQDGFLSRTQYQEVPVRVEYALTEECKSLVPILLELKAWGEAHLPVLEEAAHA